MTTPAREYSATIMRTTIFINALPSELASGRIASASNAAPTAPGRINKIKSLTNISFSKPVAARLRSEAGASGLKILKNINLTSDATRGAVQTKKMPSATLGLCIELRIAGTPASIRRDKPRERRIHWAPDQRKGLGNEPRQAPRRAPRCHNFAFRGVNKA